NSRRRPGCSAMAQGADGHGKAPPRPATTRELPDIAISKTGERESPCRRPAPPPRSAGEAARQGPLADRRRLHRGHRAAAAQKVSKGTLQEPIFGEVVISFFQMNLAAEEELALGSTDARSAALLAKKISAADNGAGGIKLPAVRLPQQGLGRLPDSAQGARGVGGDTCDRQQGSFGHRRKSR